MAFGADEGVKAVNEFRRRVESVDRRAGEGEAARSVYPLLINMLNVAFSERWLSNGASRIDAAAEMHIGHISIGTRQMRLQVGSEH